VAVLVSTAQHVAEYEVISCSSQGAYALELAKHAKQVPLNDSLVESGQRGNLTTRNSCVILDGVAGEPDGTVMRHLP
jgi:hypothetical protein